ncbi:MULTISPECIES: tRNA epoxyqueuosine(34) reductase QueG [unclassified Acidocella]|uniref:tRNA epoxyqueuosine(34) reductase QueG n=1 Tax=unclassified Acidocella TaxID=2648610 RepID=UPI00028C6E2A|nr:MULTISPECIES: tRNA epoxyqueuosine(34) reductase QueG [unclassified Acidocella]EKM98663.1 electron transport protein [Acidocella sp. MX-AZ02]WBO58874.1 tRNA epoxyqueuosine(34) reductase QueG [Acidocella sp. MX-AZ03]
MERFQNATLKTLIRDKAASLGFAATGFTRAALPPERLAYLQDFLAAGRHGGMGWMEERTEQRAHPQALWPEALSVITLGFSYAPPTDALANLTRPDIGNISVYARNRDYHDIIKGKLKHLAQFIAARGAGVKVFVDTAPVMEKPLAQQAGLGWQGKHTNLVSRAHGSWLFLGEIYTTLELEPDAPGRDLCGSCTACQEACPTAAFPAPYQLDARRCISYLTIEHDGPIPEEFRTAIGNRIYGCDDCLAVCPWNKFAKAGQELKLAARDDLTAPKLAALATLDDAGFRQKFSGSPIKRIGRNRFLRNVAIAVGNSGEFGMLPTAEQLAADDDPVVAQSGAWAAARLRG